MIAALRFEIGCTSCEAPLELTGAPQVAYSGRTSIVSAVCSGCSLVHTVVVSLVPAPT